MGKKMFSNRGLLDLLQQRVSALELDVSGDHASIEDLLASMGQPEGSIHIYMHSVNGDDSREGIGTNDPSDQNNWQIAVKTENRLRELIPMRGRTYIHTKGNFTISAPAFSYTGYRGGSCVFVSHDPPTVIDEGVIVSYTAAPAKIPALPEMTVAWDTLVPSDTEIRKHFYLVERADLASWELCKAGKYNSGDGSHTIMDLYGPSTAPGRRVRLVRPTSQITVSGWVTFLNTYFVGYEVIGADALSSVILEESGLPEYIGNCCGFGFCEVEFSYSIGLQIRTTSTDVFGTYYLPEVFGYLAMSNVDGIYSLVPGPWLSSTSGDASRRIDLNHGNMVVNNVVIDNMSVYVYGSVRAEIKAFRLVDGSKSLFRCYEGATIYFDKCFCSKINEAARASNLSVGQISLSSAAGPSGALLDLAPGAVLKGHSGGVIYVEDLSNVNRNMASLLGTFSKDISFKGGFDVSTTGTSRPYIIIEGGHHENLSLDLKAANRGPGPLIIADKNSAVMFGDTCTGDNLHANGYGLSVRDHGHAEIPNATYLLTGNGGVTTTIFFGVKGATALASFVAGTLLNDFAAAGALSATEELVSIRRRA